MELVSADPKLIDGCENEFVYFIRCRRAGAVKIGTAWNPEVRRKFLQTGCPFPLSVAAVVVAKHGSCGAGKWERRLHSAFRHLHMRGEWFHYKGDIAAFVEWLRTSAGIGDKEVQNAT